MNRTDLTQVPLPATLRSRKLLLNGVTTVAMLAIAAALFGKQSRWIGGVMVFAALISAVRFWRLRSATHVCLKNGLLQSYDPHLGVIHSMPVSEIGSIQFRPASDRNLVKLPSRFIVGSNRIARELEVFVLADEQQPKLAAFFKANFPEQYQEPVEPLPGFPLTRE